MYPPRTDTPELEGGQGGEDVFTGVFSPLAFPTARWEFEACFLQAAASALIQGEKNSGG